VKRFRSNWPLAYLVMVFAAAGALFLIASEAGRFLGDVFYGRYDGRAFYYPALYLPALSGIMVVPAACLVLLVVWMALRLRQHPAARRVSMRYALIVLFMASILAVAWLIFDFMGSRATPYARHIGSEQVGDTTYHLTAIATVNRDVYALYECVNSEWNCRAVHVEEYRAMTDPFTTLFNDIRMAVDAGTLRLVVDGETVYRSG